MKAIEEHLLINGSAGKIEILVEIPSTGDIRGVAIVAHPHPLFGGTNQNKVVQTLAHSLLAKGFIAIRPNFRGVGKSAGTHDFGVGETADLLFVREYALYHYAKLGANLQIILAGFSFGAFVQTQVLAALRADNKIVQKIILVGLAAGMIENTRHYEPAKIAGLCKHILLIHGSHDETVPLNAVISWAAPQEIPITLIPEAEHFLHRRLHILKKIVEPFLA